MAVAKIREKQCQVELATFETNFKNLDKSIEYGAVDERTYLTPCNVDKIYFVDLDKVNFDDNILLDIFDKQPVIKDSLRDKVEKNVFLVKDNELKKINVCRQFRVFLSLPYMP